jgi:hypothetical protein
MVLGANTYGFRRQNRRKQNQWHKLLFFIHLRLAACFCSNAYEKRKSFCAISEICMTRNEHGWYGSNGYKKKGGPHGAPFL